jgi:hypothetical protein
MVHWTILQKVLHYQNNENRSKAFCWQFLCKEIKIQFWRSPQLILCYITSVVEIAALNNSRINYIYDNSLWSFRFTAMSQESNKPLHALKFPFSLTKNWIEPIRYPATLNWLSQVTSAAQHISLRENRVLIARKVRKSTMSYWNYRINSLKLKFQVCSCSTFIHGCRFRHAEDHGPT